MVEFGEKIKQLREEKGMTQQSLADKLYVTRQAVSRWECGARYPDLFTAKKLAYILNVSIDELLSEEELGKNIEKEPVLARPVENVIQNILYTVATIAYMLMCIFSLSSILFPNPALANTPAGAITIITVSTVLGYLFNFCAVIVGLFLSIKNKLTAKLTGCIMCMSYILSSISFLCTYLNVQINQNGYIGISGWITDFLFPLLLAICILAYFSFNEYRFSYLIILGICILTLYTTIIGYVNIFLHYTDLGFVVRTVHCLGKIGMIFLLGYQGYVWDKKKQRAIQIKV